MLHLELNRVLLKRGYIWVLLAAIILETVMFVSAVKKEISLTGVALEVFNGYIKLYGCELTEEKIIEIEKIIDERDSAEYQKQLLTNDFEIGKITAQDYKEDLAVLKEKTKGTDGYNKFIALYETGYYETDYIADTSIWNVLLPANGFDVVYILAVIIFVLFLCTYDEETGVNSLLITMQAGKRTLQKSRIALVFLFVSFFSVFIFGGKLLLSEIYKIDGFSMPLQTVESFRYSETGLSLFWGYMGLSVIKTLGALYLAAAVMLIGELTRSTLNTVFISLIAVFMPAYLLNDSALKYLLPIPSALFSAGGYLGSSEAANFTVAENGEMLLNSLKDTHLIILFSSNIIIILVLFILDYILWIKRRRTR